MKHTLLALVMGTSALPAGTLVLSDNFNAPDNLNFDASEQAGRRTGILGPVVQLRSARVQHNLSNNQLLMLQEPNGSGRIRFQQAADLPTDVWTDFAASAAAATLLAEGGMRIAFDWTPANNTAQDWVSFNFGIDGQSTPEPGTRVSDLGTDFGILFRNAGGTQYFRNGPTTAMDGATFPVATLGTRKVVITLAFTSFADGTDVVIKASVDGTEVLPADFTFQWTGNNGTQFMELGNLAAGTRIDNFSISGLNGLTAVLAAQPFYTSIANNGAIGTFTSQANEVIEPATYTLVAGEGDTDNGKFKIVGDALLSNGFDFIGTEEGTPLSVRVRSTGVNSGLTVEQFYSLDIIADNDSDDLPDAWEFTITDVLTDLNGRLTGPGPGSNTGDFDGDGLTDLQEYNLIRSTYPTLNPVADDTDGDGVKDGEEVNPTAPRVASNPTDEDSDNDGLNDLIENNSGIFTNGGSPGTNSAKFDTDDDGFPDNYEIDRNSSPVDANQVPGLPAPLSTAVLTTDASTGISTSKTYTHAISGGYAAQINGVDFAPLKPTETPDNFTWAATTSTGANAAFTEIAAENFGAWVPGGGSVTESGLLGLFGGFAYSGNGDLPGSFQTYTLDGLTAGQTYELRFYVRVWAKVESGRPISLTFENGAQSVNAYILEDRPAIMLGNGNADSAYALIFPYTAEGSSLTITAAVPATTVIPSGSWHLYGLTNEAVAPNDGSFVITGIVYQPTPVPTATLTFTSEPNAVYSVEYSTALTAAGQPGGWVTLATNISSMGNQTIYTDTTAAGTAPRLFYRARRTSP